jgi:hypothetical protein
MKGFSSKTLAFHFKELEKIRAENNSHGVGSLFSFSIPLSE